MSRLRQLYLRRIPELIGRLVYTRFHQEATDGWLISGEAARFFFLPDDADGTGATVMADASWKWLNMAEAV